MPTTQQLIKDKPMGRRLKCRCIYEDGEACNYEWHARIEGRDPPYCPSCLSLNWNDDPALSPRVKRRKWRPKPRGG